MILEIALWSLLIVRADNSYDLKEGIKSEAVCRETLCYLQWQLSCDDHKKKVEDDKRKAELAEIERKRAQLIYQVDHPCVVKEDGRKTCSTSAYSSDTYDKDGKLLFSSSGLTYSTSGVFIDRSVKVVACFQAKDK